MNARWGVGRTMSNQDQGSARKGRSQKAAMFIASSQEKRAVNKISRALYVRSMESEVENVAESERWVRSVAFDVGRIGTPCDCA